MFFFFFSFSQKCLATFYKMKMGKELDTLDQRMTDDVEKFCSTLTFVYGHILKPTLDTIFLTNALGGLMGYKQIFMFYVYFFGMNQVFSSFFFPSLLLFFF